MVPALRVSLVVAALSLPPPAGAGAGARGPVDGLRAVASPAAPGSAAPNLAVGPDGTVWLSWLERRAAGGHALRGARLEGGRWARPFTVAEGDSFFANWADFPMVLPLAGGRLVAHYLWRSGEETYAYDVRITQSADGGRTWSAPLVPHRDGTKTEHGFVSMVPAGAGARLVWLDGRGAAAAGHGGAGHGAAHGEAGFDMTLRAAAVGPDGSLAEEALLDPRTCECCQTAAVATGGAVLVAYRDRGADEVRDIALVRLENGSWSAPYPLHEDGWTIPGCPVNGPALEAAGERVVAAWYTGAGDSARVLAAFSDDGGRRFAPPVRIDDGDPLGRVDVALLEDGSALVVWLESDGREALIRLRRVHPDGGAGTPATVARTTAARASGFPRLARSAGRVVLAWTEPGKPSRVRTALARPARLTTR